MKNLIVREEKEENELVSVKKDTILDLFVGFVVAFLAVFTAIASVVSLLAERILINVSFFYILVHHKKLFLFLIFSLVLLIVILVDLVSEAAKYWNIKSNEKSKHKKIGKISLTKMQVVK